jgi:hypothetical protein
MKNFLMMIFAGMIGAGLTGIFRATSLENVATAQSITEAISSGFCTVRVGMGRVTAGGRCYNGQVMSGTMTNDLIYCSDINVSCSNVAESN